jgi:hypothetical protein
MVMAEKHTDVYMYTGYLISNFRGGLILAAKVDSINCKYFFLYGIVHTESLCIRIICVVIKAAKPF